MVQVHSPLKNYDLYVVHGFFYKKSLILLVFLPHYSKKKSSIDLKCRLIKNNQNMNFNPIHWLRLAKPLPVKIKTHIDGHYICKLKNYFVVFTSKPVRGIECAKVSNNNIKGEEKPQYIAHVVHKCDPTIHKLTQPSECNSYYAENKTSIDFISKKIFQDYND